MYTKTKKGDHSMRKVYIKRRIAVFTVITGIITAFCAIVNEPEVYCEVPSFRAEAGDTMWDGIYENCPKFRHRMDDVTNIVIKMNGKATIDIGQIVFLPQKNDK